MTGEKRAVLIVQSVSRLIDLSSIMDRSHLAYFLKFGTYWCQKLALMYIIWS